MTSMLSPVTFDAPLVNPSPVGLYGATSWQPQVGPPRWLPGGVDIRVFNYGGESAFGVWGADWCASEDDLGVNDMKEGERPEFPASFEAMTVWAYDSCDPTADSRTEVRARAQQVLRLQEQTAVERTFAARLLTDGGTADTAADIVGAVAQLEGVLAETSTLGVIHASAMWAASAAQANLIVRTSSGLKTPLGHSWVFGGGYVQGLGDTLVATSPVFGWRTEPAVQDALRTETDVYAAIAERSVLVGYESALGAVEVTG